MNVNYTGGARKTFRRVSSRTQQDITGTPAYHPNQRVRGRARERGARRHSSSRTHSSNLNGQKTGAKRRKIGHRYDGMPQFDFAHARRDQEEQSQRTIEQANRIRHERNYNYGRSSTNAAPLKDYNPPYDVRPTFETHRGSTLQPAGETRSPRYIWQDDTEALDSYEQAQMAQSNRESSILRSSSIQASLPSALHPLLPFQLPQKRPLRSQPNFHDSCANRETFLPPPSYRPQTQMSSHSSNPASLSIISSPPHILPPYSTTPTGSPPPLPSLDGAPQSNQTFLTEESSKARLDQSIDTNPPSSTLQEFSTDDQDEETHQTLNELSNEQQQTPSDESNQLDSSLSLSNLQISASGQSAIEGNDRDLPLEIERLVSHASRSFTVLPPRFAEWTGPCCVTRFQRDQLASSFIFTNKLLEGDEGENPVFVSDRMGLGCRGISQEEAIKLIQFEVSLRSNNLEVRFDDTEEREEEEVRFEDLEWEEEDFEDQEQDSFSSPCRRPPDPPPVPLFDSIPSPERSTTTVAAERRKVTLSNGPWNDLEPEDESQTQSLAKGTFNLDSSTATSHSASVQGPPSFTTVSLDQLGDYEDISTRWKLLHYESAYESHEEEEGGGGDCGRG